MQLIMENSQIIAPNGGQEPNNGRYISADELIAKMRLAFTNAREPEILAELKNVGFSEADLTGSLGEVERLEALSAAQKKEYGEQYDATDGFNSKMQEIDQLFTRHRNLAKIAFKNNRQAYATLGIDEPKKLAYSAWFQQVKNFYAQLLANADFKAKAETISISPAVIAAQQDALAQLSALKEAQKKETGEAQKATETRDDALDALYPKYRDLIDYAMELFKDDQTLEKLGIVVKRPGK